jgi:hypothetical protein
MRWLHVHGRLGGNGLGPGYLRSSLDVIGGTPKPRLASVCLICLHCPRHTITVAVAYRTVPIESCAICLSDSSVHLIVVLACENHSFARCSLLYYIIFEFRRYTASRSEESKRNEAEWNPAITINPNNHTPTHSKVQVNVRIAECIIGRAVVRSRRTRPYVVGSAGPAERTCGGCQRQAKKKGFPSSGEAEKETETEAEARTFSRSPGHPPTHTPGHPPDHPSPITKHCNVETRTEEKASKC